MPDEEEKFEYQGEGYTIKNPPPGYERTSKANMELHNRELKKERLMPTTDFRRRLGNLGISVAQNYADTFIDQKFTQRGTAGPRATIDQKFAQRGSVQAQGPRTPGALGGDPFAGWDYQNPPTTADGTPLNHKGEELPELAEQWAPTGKPYYGKGFSAAWKKATQNTRESMVRGWGLDVEGKEKWWERAWQASWGQYSLFRTALENTGTFVMPPLEAPAKGAERIIGTSILASEEIANEGGRAFEDFIGDDLERRGAFGQKASTPPEWMTDVAERLSIPRNIYNSQVASWRVIKGEVSFKDVAKKMQKHWQISRMAYSIGANDEITKQEFFQRVRDGEDPRMVALDMEQPLSEMVGLVLNDPLNALDIVMGGAVRAKRIMSASDWVVTMSDEVARVANMGDDPMQVLRGVSGSDAMVGAVKSDMAKVVSGMSKEAGRFGLFHRIGSAKRSKVFTDIGIFSRAIGFGTNSADETADIIKYMAMLASDSDEEVRVAIDFLVDAMDNPNMAFSEPGLEFAHYMRNMMDDGTGVNPQKFLDGVQGLIDEDDLAGLMEFTLGRLEDSINRTYPTIQEIVEAENLIGAGEDISDVVAHPGAVEFLENGGELRLIDRWINTSQGHGPFKGLFRTIQGNVAGRLFIGMNVGVPMRGAGFDTFLSSVDMGADINRYSPQRWAELSEVWLGFEHPGLVQGFSKADVARMDDWAAAKSSYKDMGTLFEAIINKGATKGGDVGMAEAAFETLTNPGGRMMQWFEMKHSQRVVGKASQDAMKHLLTKTMPKIDELVQAGLSEDTARSITRRLVNKYGDVDAVQAQLLKEISNGSIDTFRDLSWMPDEIEAVVDEFNLYDEIVEAVSAGTKEEVLTKLKSLRDELLGTSKHLNQQHAAPARHPSSMSEDIGTALGGMYRAVEDGVLNRDDVDEVANIVQANQNTVDSVSRAFSQVKKQLFNRIRAATRGNLDLTQEAITRIDEAIDAVPNATDEWANITGTNRGRSKKAWEFTERLGSAKTGELAALKQEIWDFFDFTDDIPRSRQRVKDYMWTHHKEGITEDFSRARSTAVAIFGEYLDQISELVPEQIFDEIANHADVQAVFRNEDIAVGIEQSVFINGEHKALGQVIRGFMGIGDNANANRSIAAFFDPYIHSIKPGQTFHDTKIKQIANRFSDVEFETLAELEPEVVFEAFQRYRQNEGLPRIMDDISELVGYKPSVQLPDEIESGRRIAQIVKQKTLPNGAELGQLTDFIHAQGNADELARLREVENTEEVVDIANDIIQRTADDITLLPFSEITDDDTITIYQGRPKGKGGRSQSWTRDLQRARGFGDEIYTAEVSGAEWRAAVQEARGRPGMDVTLEGKAGELGLEEGILPQEVAESAQRLVEETTEDVINAVDTVIPPHDGAAPSFPRHVHESRDRIWATFNNLMEGIRENYGRTRPEGISDELVGAIDNWFTEAKGRMPAIRGSAAKYAQEMRNFVLHDYTNRMGIDALLSSFQNFHFWPTRTAYKTIKRVPYNLGLINKYALYRDAVGKIHADSPEWYRYQLNSNEILGLNMDNPVFFSLENMLNPFSNMMGGFDNPDKRVNWWSSVIDGLSRGLPGHPNLFIQYGTALALKMQGEDEAAALWGGRLAPVSEQVKGISSLLGANEGRGIELDPAIRTFSGEGFFDQGFAGRSLGPYERKRVVNALSQIAAENPEIEAEAIEDAWKNGGPLWDQAIAMARKKDAVGRLTSTFTGVGARLRSKEDLTISQYWQDYFKVYSMKEDMSPEQYRNEMQALNELYPFAEVMMLGRRGADERDGAYAYSVLNRIPPGQTDDFVGVMGLPYEMVEKFYDDKGDFSDWEEGDRKRFMGAMATMGATLDLPDNAVQREWTEASIRYTNMIELMQENFGESIMERIDAAYNQKGAGPVNSQDAFSDYLEQNPTVEAAMEWRTRYVLSDPVMAAYYGGLDKLRKYYEGRMWEKLSNQFGNDIWDKWAQWGSYKDTGQDEKASQYKKQHPELKAYSEAKKEMSGEIEDIIIEFGNRLPEGQGAVLREDAGEGMGEQQVIESETEFETRNFTKQEWSRILTPELTRIAILAYEGQPPPDDIREMLEDAAIALGMEYNDLIVSIGTGD